MTTLTYADSYHPLTRADERETGNVLIMIARMVKLGHMTKRGGINAMRLEGAFETEIVALLRPLR